MKNSTSPSHDLPSSSGSLKSESMSIEEMLRIMDVASQFRKRKDMVEREFRNDESHAALRQKLLEAAEVTGEEISEKEINAAIDWYYEHLHTFKPPRFEFGMMFAHLYIRRGLVLCVVLGLVALYLAYWMWSRS